MTSGIAIHGTKDREDGVCGSLLRRTPRDAMSNTLVVNTSEIFLTTPSMD